ncbi:hypothetical protein [uncultured Sunxiuqinia sp.]|uniref:hypothetical protein n=1 Tax=uncultured Sunxiuqinia sp. TaxID=1573825 RepID=UPI00261FB854|nr:hypothetical protein [uncultured Sunxiuqinia sp.]
MKKSIIISLLALLIAATSTVQAKNYPNEYLGLPGDNLNLYATMKLFQESETLEDFERSLNDENSRINNLDLNGDRMVDYLMVIDYVDGHVHNIVLRAALNQNETQDVAVFTVERFNDGSARIQLIGDEALYGPNYIVEPIYADNQERPNPGYIGNSTVVVERPSMVAVTTFQVAAWPVIRFIYRPSYVSWHSSWRWGHYPSYWRPWRPYYWHTYYGYHTHYHNHYYAHYRHSHHHHYKHYNKFYYSRVRTYSPRVSARIKQGSYRKTYSRPDLRRKGDVLYKRTARKNQRSRENYSDSRRRTSSSSVSSRPVKRNSSVSHKRSGSSTTTRVSPNSSVNRRSSVTRKSSAVQPNRSVNNSSSGRSTKVSRRTSPSSNSTYRSGTKSSVKKQSRPSPKSTTIKTNRTTRSSYSKPSNSSSKRSSTSVSRKSNSQPKSSSRSVRSRSSSSKPKATVRSSSSSSKTSKAASKSRQSRSSSSKRSGRR